MTFDEWFKDFKDVGIGTYTIEALKQAFEAGLHADVHTDNSAVITELEKENAELKESVDFWEERYWILNDVYVGVVKENNDKLTKAKEIIKELLDTQTRLDPYRDIFKDRILKAEQFLNEVEE